MLHYRLVTDFHTDARKDEYADDESCGSAVVLSYPGGVLLGQHVNGPSMRYERQSDGQVVPIDERRRALRTRLREGGDGIDADGNERRVGRRGRQPICSVIELTAWKSTGDVEATATV